MDKPARDAVFEKAKSRDFPLLFVDGEAIGVCFKFLFVTFL